MTKLSKYQLKQLSPAERTDYEDGLFAQDHNTTHCFGGKVVISDDGDEWSITSYDNDDYQIDVMYGVTREEVEYHLEEMVEALDDDAS